MFKTIDRYVLKLVLTPLAATLVISLTLLLAERMLGFLDVTLGKKNSFTAVFKMLAYLTPNYLGLAVPIALFLGVLFSFNRLSKSREIDALNAAGISLPRLFRPVLGLAIILMLFNLVAVGWLQPYGRYSYRSVVYTLTNVNAFDLAKEGIFMKTGDRTFIVDQLNQSDNSFEKLFVFEDKGLAGSETLTAATGILINGPDQKAPILRMQNSDRLRLDAAPDLVGTGALSLPTRAQSQTVDLPLDSVAGNVFRPRGSDERELSLLEIYNSLDAPPQNTSLQKMVAEFHNRVIKILSIPLLALIALPFALARPRTVDAYRIGAAIFVMVAINIIIEQTSIAASVSGFSPWLVMWPPFLALTAFGLWRFWQVSYTVRVNG
jgi:lipopolysaccharide export system permease protein